MDISQFVASFTDCLQRTDPAHIKPDTEFKKLEEWSSILALIVISMVDSEYSLVLTAEDIRQATTIADLHRLINTK